MPVPPTEADRPQGTFVYVGELALDPLSITPTANADALASYQVMADGSLKRLGAFDRSAFPAAIFESVAAGPWLFTCDMTPRCQEFRVDNTGNLVRGADISSAGLHEVGAIDPTATWLIAAGNKGEQAFRIQADGTLMAGPQTPFQSPGPLDGMGFFIKTFDPTGNYVFARNLLDVSQPPAIYRFDSSSGVFVQAALLPPEIFAIGFHFMGFTPDGRHALGVEETLQSTGDVFVFDWDPSTATLAIHNHRILTVADLPEFYPFFMTMADNLIFAQGGVETNVVFRFDAATATISDTGQRFPQDMVRDSPMRADAKTHTVIGTTTLGNMVGVWTYDPVTGATKRAPGSPHASGETPEIMGLVAH